jgi:phosphoribosylformylglycinamidine cyclo-ligase
MTYAQSGVNIDKEENAINEILSNFKFVRKGIGEPLGGHYAGIIKFGKYALVLCTDGVGSKVKIASELKKWNTIGIDCIAMNVNDAICVGAEPLAFVDYLAIDYPSPKITRAIGEGLAKGAEISNISIIGGETASLPDIIKGFDLAGTCLGYLEKNSIITGEQIKVGDIIIGLKSSGIHSNGYTLVRKIIEKSKYNYKDILPSIYDINETQRIGDMLLIPTNIYVKEILELIKKIDVHGLAHITGGGLKNFIRLNNNVKYIIEDPFEPHAIFKFLQKQGNVTDKEMYKTFNMGMGFSIIVNRNDLEESINILQKNSKFDIKLVGRVEKGSGVCLPKLKLIY